METIPARTLRNDVSKILRAAERGERFIVTVDRRPAAEIGPVTAPATIRLEDALEVGISTSQGQALKDDIAEFDTMLDGEPTDPWSTQ